MQIEQTTVKALRRGKRMHRRFSSHWQIETASRSGAFISKDCSNCKTSDDLGVVQRLNDKWV